MNLFAATNLELTLPFLFLNWLWVGWCALELKGSQKYGIQSTIGLLTIFFLSIFQYLNFVVFFFIVAYTRERVKYWSSDASKKQGGHIENTIKSLIRNYDKDRKQQGIKQ